MIRPRQSGSTGGSRSEKPPDVSEVAAGCKTVMEHRDQEKTVVVLGLARSGTSVVTAMLRTIGVEMGSSRHDKANPLGSFEDLDFAELHRQIFEATGADHSYWNPPRAEEILEFKERWSPQIREILAQKSTQAKIWGWKHPRTLLTIELFLPHLNNPHFVAVFRNPLDIANSSVEHTKNYKSGKVDFLRAMRLAHFYYGEMVKVLETHREVPMLLVAFEEVVAQPLKEAARLCDFLGLPLTDDKMAAVHRLVIPRDQIAQEKRLAAGLFTGKIPRLIRNCSLRVFSDRKTR